MLMVHNLLRLRGAFPVDEHGRLHLFREHRLGLVDLESYGFTAPTGVTTLPAREDWWLRRP